jgi:RNA polymerase sigma-70 factor (ECF subfamily)
VDGTRIRVGSEDPRERRSEPEREAEAELARLMDAYGADVLRLAYAYLRNRASAEDAYQETFLRAHRRRSSFEGRSSEKTWMMRIAMNVCRDMRRSAWWRRVLLPGVDRAENAQPHADGLPEEAAVRAERDDLLLRCVAALPEPQRAVVLLHYYQEMSVPDVAEALGVAEGTVRSRLHRARERLRRAWRREEEGMPAWID